MDDREIALKCAYILYDNLDQINPSCYWYLFDGRRNYMGWIVEEFPEFTSWVLTGDEPQRYIIDSYFSSGITDRMEKYGIRGLWGEYREKFQNPELAADKLFAFAMGLC